MKATKAGRLTMSDEDRQKHLPEVFTQAQAQLIAGCLIVLLAAVIGISVLAIVASLAWQWAT